MDIEVGKLMIIITPTITSSGLGIMAGVLFWLLLVVGVLFSAVS